MFFAVRDAPSRRRRGEGGFLRKGKEKAVGNELLQKIKAGAAGALGLVTAWLGALAMPVYILVGLNIADYATGIVAAPYRGERRSSAVGFRGIAKKVSMWLLVALGGVMDWLLAYAAETAGMEIPFRFPVAALVAAWLICNEIVSILENIGDIGVELPPFLGRLVEWVKRAAGETARLPDGPDAGEE